MSVANVFDVEIYLRQSGGLQKTVYGSADILLRAANGADTKAGSDAAKDVRLFFNSHTDASNDIRLYPNPNKVRITQQLVEVITSGDPADQNVRLTQQLVEVITSGDPGAQNVRITQQLVEVICTFGTPPVGNSGKKDNAPGQIKKDAKVAYIAWLARQRRDRIRHQRRWPYDVLAASSDPRLGFVSPNPDPIREIDIIKIVKH